MPLQSDFTLDTSKIGSKAISERTKKLNEFLTERSEAGPSWWKVGASKYRSMRKTGDTPFPVPTVLEHLKDFSIPSRDAGRDIPCRYAEPKDGKAKGIMIHIHGGGWVLGDHESNDPWLNFFTEQFEVVTVSIGYRRAPEDPFPAGPNDCYDAVEWLVANSVAKFGAEVKFIGGESAGAHLSVLSILHMRTKLPNFHFRGTVLSFGAYDLSMPPSARHFTKLLVLNTETINNFLDAFLPGMSGEERRHPEISPLYADLSGQELPPALFLIGTEDSLLDDTLFMSSRWLANGHQAVVKIYPGAPHGFITLPVEASDMAKKGREDIVEFIRDLKA